MIIRTIITANGATIRVHNDCMVAPGTDEERQIIESQCRAAYDILREEAERHEPSD